MRLAARVALVVFVSVACSPDAGDAPPSDDAGDARGAKPSADGRRTILAWLECDECWDGELAAVIELGQDAVPVLAATLEAGLSPATRARLELELAATYERSLESHSGRSRTDWSEREFIEHHVRNREELHRSRAAIALGRIGGPRANDSLRAALDSHPSRDVAMAIRTALGESP